MQKTNTPDPHKVCSLAGETDKEAAIPRRVRVQHTSGTHEKDPLTHRGSDMETDTHESRVSGMSRGKRGKVKREKKERKGFPGKGELT